MSSKKTFLQHFLVHMVLWLLYLGLLLYPFIAGLRPISSDLPMRFFFMVLLFYFNYYYLVPKILLKNTTLRYVSISILIVLAISIALYFGFPQEERILRNVGKAIEGRSRNLPFGRFFFTLLGLLVPFVISVVLRIYVEWKRNEDLRKIVETEKVHSELQFLKTQLNPHFLFNSLNAIYSLSVKKSPDTSEAIINLSELMRYMLYEADKDFVPLRKELEYIQNYVQLQRLRLSDSTDVTLNISGEYKEKAIPPLLFISFIENAFKYGTDYEGKTSVKINLLIENESIHLNVLNKIGAFKKKSKSSGVGLENIRNRLQLLYPHSHQLIVKNDGHTYKVDLTLKL